MISYFEAYSCSCGSGLSIKEEFNNKDLIVTGRVVSNELVAVDSTGKLIIQNEVNFYVYQFRRYQLEIKKVYKGHFSKDTIHVYSSSSDSNCGYFFQVGKSYLVYGTDHEINYPNNELMLPSGNNLIWTDMCTRTKEYDKKEARKLKRLAR